TLSSGIRCEITVGPKSAVHRYTFPGHRDARVVVDASLGGLAIPHGATVPLRAHLETVAPRVAQGQIVVEGAPLAIHVECDNDAWRQMLWYDRRLMPGGTRLDFDHIRPTTLRPFGLMWAGPSEPGQTIELRFGTCGPRSGSSPSPARTSCSSAHRPSATPPSPFPEEPSRSPPPASSNPNPAGPCSTCAGSAETGARSTAPGSRPGHRPHAAPSLGSRGACRPRDLRPLRRGPQPRRGRPDTGLRRGPHPHLADRASPGQRPPPETAGDRPALQSRDHGGAARTGRRLPRPRRAVPGRAD